MAPGAAALSELLPMARSPSIVPQNANHDTYLVLVEVFGGG